MMGGKNFGGMKGGGLGEREQFALKLLVRSCMIVR